MKIYKITVNGEQAIPLTQAEPGMQISRPLINPSTDQFLFPKNTLLTVERLNRARTFNVSKIVVHKQHQCWVDEEQYIDMPENEHVETLETHHIGNENVNKDGEQDDELGLERIEQILRNTVSLPIYGAILRRIGERIDGPAGNDEQEKLDQLFTQFNDLRQEKIKLNKRLETVNQGETREELRKLLEGLLKDVEPLLMKLDHADSTLFQIRHFTDLREKHRSSLIELVEDYRKKRSYLHPEDRANRPAVNVDSFVDVLLNGVDWINEGQFVPARDVLKRWINAGVDEVSISAQKLSNWERETEELDQRRNRLVHKIYEKSSTRKKRDRLLRALMENPMPPPDFSSLLPSNELREPINRYLETRQAHRKRTWQLIQRLGSQVIRTAEYPKQKELANRFNQVVYRVNQDSTAKDLLRNPEDVTQWLLPSREPIDSPLRAPNLERVSESSGLKRSVVESALDLYRIPDDLRKGKSRLLNSFRSLIENMLFRADVDLDGARRFVRQLDEIFARIKNPLNLIVQPTRNDRYLLAHSFNVAVISTRLAHHLQLPEVSKTLLLLASGGSDLGMSVVPPSFLEQEELTPQAHRQIEKHPKFSEAFMRRVFGPFHPVNRLVREHHERIDGSGYPAGTRGDDHHLWSGILSLSDAYTALMEPRSFRSKQRPRQALETLIEHRDTFRHVLLSSLFQILGKDPKKFGVNPAEHPAPTDVQATYS